MSLDVDVTIANPGLTVEARVSVGDEIVVVIGPNGAGKTTLLRAIAGLTPIDKGCIAFDGQVFDDPERRLFMPAADRNVGFMLQDYALFPTMTALENIAFGPRCRGVAKPLARQRAREWLARVNLEDRASARPAMLSGGEAQRVAFARALASEPAIVALDEPLTALDASTRVEIRREMRAILAEHPGPRVIVTHDAIDAIAFADRIVVLEAGRVAQDGTPEEIRSHPRSRYVADFVGVNLLRGHSEHGRVTLADGGVLIAASGIDGDVLATVHPGAVALHVSRPDGTPRNVWPATITTVDDYGDRVRVGIAGLPSLVVEITATAANELGLRAGQQIWASLKATEVSVSPD